MADQTFRIEIPIEAFNKTDVGQLEKLERTLQNVVDLITRVKTEFSSGAAAMERSASSMTASITDAKENLDQMNQAAAEVSEAAADMSGNVEDVSSSAEKTGEAIEGIGDAAEEAGKGFDSQAKSADKATTKTDKFTKSIEKTEQQLSKLTKNRHELLLELKDKASAAFKAAWGVAQKLTSKAFHFVLRLKDFVTAPFRKLWGMVFNPITAGAAALGISVGLADSINTFGTFTSTMSNVKALTGATSEEFAKLEAQARSLGATTAFSATEAAQGMTFLASAGWSITEISDAMPGMMDLAAAGGTDLATASDIVASVMTAMGLAANTAGHTADVFAEASAKTNVGITDLGEAMKYAAPIATAFGMSLEETTALIALMGNAGIKGSNAGTAMRSALLRMADTGNKEVNRVLKLMKVSFTDASGKMKDTKTIVGELSVAFSKLSQQKRLEYAQTVFGTEAASAWLAVLDQGPDALQDLTLSLVNSQGAAQEMAETRLDNLPGDIEELKGALDEAKIALMTELEPYLRTFVQWLTDKIPGATETLTGLIQAVIDKAGEVKEAVSEMINSEEWENANWAEKLFIAWDTLIVEPFDTWWNSGGSAQVVGIASTIGETMGATLSGLILGALAALTGEEIDYEGLNLTPMAKAGLETGVAFFNSFAEAFDIEGILKKIPSAVQAVLSDAGKLLPGGEDPSATSWLSAGATVWAGSKLHAFFGSLGVSVGTLKTGLEGAGAAIKVLGTLPPPVLAAAAILASVAIGVKLYTDNLERQRQALLHMGESIDDAVDKVDSSYKKAQLVEDVIKEYQTLQDKIDLAETYGGDLTKAEGDLETLKAKVQELQEAMDELDGQQITIGTVEASAITTALAGMEDDVTTLQAAIAIIEAGVTAGTVTAEEYTTSLEELKTNVDTLTAAKAALEAEITTGTVNAGTVSAALTSLDDTLASIEAAKTALQADFTAGKITATDYETQMAALDGYATSIQEARVQISTTITAAGFDLTTYTTQKAAIQQDIDDLNAKQAVIKAIIDEGGLTEEGLKDYERRLNELGTSLTELSNGLITQYDIENGKVAEKLGLLEQQLALQKEIAKEQLRTELVDKRGKVEPLREELSSIDQQISEIEGQQGPVSQRVGQERLAMTQVELIAQQWETNKTGFLNGTVTEEQNAEFLSGYNEQLFDAYKSVMQILHPEANEDVLRQNYDQLVNSSALPAHEALMEQLSFIFDEDNNALTSSQQKLEQLYGDRNTGMSSLASLYSGEKRMIEYDTMDGATLEEQAANYANLTAEEKRAFAEAVSGLEALNQQMDYLPDELQVDARTLWTMAGQSYTTTGEIPTDETNPGGSTTGMGPAEVGAAITNLKTQTTLDKHGNTALTQQLMDNEGAYTKLQELRSGIESGQDVSDLYAYFKDRYGYDYSQTSDPAGAIESEIVNERQGIYGNHAGMISQGIQAVQQIDTNITGYQQQNTALDEQKTKLAGVMDILNQYKDASKLDESGQADALKAINEALESVNIDKIDDLTQLSEAVNSVKVADTDIDTQMEANLALIEQSNIDKVAALEALTNAFDTLQFNADREVADILKMSDDDKARFDSLADSVGDVRQQCEDLAKTYNVKIKFTFSVGKFNFGMANGGIVGNADGGMYPSGGFLSWVAEDGPEAIIPLGAKRRERGLSLWKQAGEALGVYEMAEGGVVGERPFRMMTTDDEHEPYTAGVPSGSSAPISQNIQVTPTFEIKSDRPDDVMDKIREKLPELSEEIAVVMGPIMEDLFSNMPR